MRTTMGGADAPNLPAESAVLIKRTVDGEQATDNGPYIDTQGNYMPWSAAEFDQRKKRPSMQFLVLTRRNSGEFTAKQFAEKFDLEVARARELYKEQFTRQIWHRADGSGACQIVEGPDEDYVWDKIRTLPFASAGMLDITIVPLKPYTGFSG